MAEKKATVPPARAVYVLLGKMWMFLSSPTPNSGGSVVFRKDEIQRAQITECNGARYQ